MPRPILGGPYRSPYVNDSRRTCTDVVFLVLFAFFWLGMIAVAGLAYSNGEPARLMFGKDVAGDVCGVEEHSDKPYLWWRESKMTTARRWSDLQGVCVSSCPTDGDVVYAQGEICTEGVGCAVTISTVNIQNRCFPTTVMAGWLPGYQVAWYEVSSVSFAAFRGLGDAQRSIGAILVAGGLIAFLWAISLQAMWRLQKLVLESTYGYMAGSVVALVLMCVAFITRYLIDAGGTGLVDINLAFFGIFLIVLLVYVLMMGRVWSTLRVEAVFDEVAMKIVNLVPQVFGFVTFMAILMMILFTYWVEIAAYICSSEETYTKHAQTLAEFDQMSYDDDEVTVITTVGDSHVTALMWYHFIGLLWTMEFFLCFTVTVIANLASSIMFSNNFMPQSGWVICSAVTTTIRYSLGSIAAGSFYIVILWPFRMIGGLFFAVDWKKCGAGSSIGQILCCCCICTSWCFEMCVKYTNKIAFVVVGMQGLSFCTSSQVALHAIMYPDFKVKGELMQMMTVVKYISIKFVIATVAGLIVWLWVGYEETVESPLFPVLLAFMLGYFIAGVALQAFQTTKETALVVLGLPNPAGGVAYPQRTQEELKNLFDYLRFNDQ